MADGSQTSDPLRRHMNMKLIPCRGAYGGRVRWEKHRVKFVWIGDVRWVRQSARLISRREWRSA